ncbi:hypothetical protein FRUB_04119 [Fimbriiglobus ruber]|uniref:VRR-NUC domain-containing protein n=1 Tax=Fimbriiglobus ruber TaxID=1908690 RepID=A0A225DKS6_9BACT|nr:hypothetical protein FRUB_04119 [Fimbriiglobus ruber]
MAPVRISERDFQRLLPGFQLPKRARKTKNSTTENPVREAGRAWLEYHGCDVIRNNTAAGWLFPYVKGKATFHSHEGRFIRFGKPGSADLLAISPSGRWVEAEAKSEDGSQSPEQIDRQQEVERRGGVYVLFRSVGDLEARKREILATDW